MLEEDGSVVGEGCVGVGSGYGVSLFGTWGGLNEAGIGFLGFRPATFGMVCGSAGERRFGKYLRFTQQC